MRLLNSTSFEVAEFAGDKIPPYAVLSHTWDVEEVTLGDILQQDYRHLKGFVKIDTCCIDKSSSAEMFEAITSMYQWYYAADVCYVYLCDVPPLDPFLDKHMLQSARWLTR
ncbi:hypothetical protein QQZ08_011256 [Neonectria magnoliae]|uniref:Heterokaryon incompatibility domain-containing protein n=1 Tax=Neonectria magnoliae TaxID=2732573 RepID=A0ABR1HBF6_9HYPO